MFLVRAQEFSSQDLAASLRTTYDYLFSMGCFVPYHPSSERPLMIGSTARVCGADVALEMTTQSDTKLPIGARFVEKTGRFARI